MSLNHRKCIVACFVSSFALGCADEAPACDSVPTIHVTGDGVEFVRTPDACFEGLPEWPYEARYVEIDGMRQAYIDEGGPDGAVVLLLPGNPSWSYLYRKMIPPLVDAGFRVIAMDHLGMGRSDKPIAIGFHTYVSHGDRLQVFLETLDLRDIHLFVHDWGSLIGLRIAGLDPARFASLAIASGNLPLPPAGARPFPDVQAPNELSDIPSPYLGVPAQQQPFYREDDRCELIAPYEFTPWFVQWMTWSMKGRSYSASHVHEALTWNDLTEAEEAAYDAPFPSRIYMAAPRSFPSLSNTVGSSTVDAWEELTRFERPVLTIWGDNDYLDIGACEVQDRLACGFPGAAGQPHARIPGASHYVQDDQGAEVAARWLDFVRRSGQFPASYTPRCQAPIGENRTGTPCASDQDCESLPAATCLVLSAGGGFCTIEGCAGDECGEGFACCRECNPAVPLEVSACFPVAAVPQVEAAAGCTCD